MKYLSVCSGIEAASVAWHPLGWEPVAFSEVDPFASAVLAHRYPNTPNLGDMTKYANWELPAFDLLVGGTPCQSFSVAGLRKGLEDPRGNLMLVYLGLLDRFRPRWCVWENVPGVLSSNGGRDFGTFLGGLGELGYGFAYRVLDAQFVRVESHPRAVPQRRQRVFVVGHSGADWRSAAEVLLEPEGVRGNPPTRRQARKATSPHSGSGAASGDQVGPVPKSWGINSDAVDRSGEHADGTAAKRSGLGISLEVQPTLKARPTNSVATGATRDLVDGVVALNFQGGKGNSAVSTDGSCPTLAAMHGSDVHVVAVPSIVNIEHGLHDSDNPNSVQLRDVSEPLTRSEHKGHSLVLTAGAPVTAARESGKGYWVEDNVAGTVDANMGASGSGTSRAAILAVEVPRVASDDTIAFKAGISASAWGISTTQGFSPTLQGQNNGSTQVPSMVTVAPSLTATNDPSRSPQGAEVTQQATAVYASSLAVRRLTPRECERLQGFPDNYTLVPYKGKLAGDSGRYKTLGNSMSVNVMRFIGERIHRHVEASTKK